VVEESGVKTERSNTQWVQALGTDGLERDRALADLRQSLLTGLKHGLSGWRRGSDSRFELYVEDFVQEALLKIMDNLDSFEGRSRFTTWAQKIAVRVALTELRRKRWQDVSLNGMMETKTQPPLPDPQDRPEKNVDLADMMQWMQRMMREELTDKQMQAMGAIQTLGIPLEEVARKIGTNRNALYKLLHDARIKIRRRLERDGINLQEMMADMGM